MKNCIIIPDGAADFPLRELGGKTPLQAAKIPNMDRAAAQGLLGRVSTVPRRMEPGSDVAIMTLMGYDPLRFHTGRAPLEAADLGIVLKDAQWAFRCNFINVENRVLKDFSAGNISTEEAGELIEALNDGLAARGCRFYTGTGYRHLMLCENPGHMDVTTSAPHQVMGEPLDEILPSGNGAEYLTEVMEESVAILKDHPVNIARRKEGSAAANMIWLWGEGRKPQLEPFLSRYGKRGAAISAVNLVRGIAGLVGWHIIEVPGITGYTDTDYAAKGKYAIDAFPEYDLLLVHIEAPDEASHQGDASAKIEALEQIDRKIVGPIMEYADKNADLRLLVLPDHVTSVESRRHMRGTVPFAMWGCGIKAASGLGFTEATALETDLVLENGYELMGFFLKD